jgi:hypothetical protein
LTLAECSALPTGTTTTYINVTRPTHQWAATTFQGQAAIARSEFAAGAAFPQVIWYYQADTAAQTLTTLGQETLDSNGNVTRRVSYTGRVHSTALATGASETVNYTVKNLLPSGADQFEQEVVTYVGNEEVTLPGGRLNTCKLTRVSGTQTVQAGPVTELTQEQLYLGKNLGLVKSYYKPTGQIFLFDRGQTYLIEMSNSTAAVGYVPATAATTPSLASCGTMAAGQELVVTASNPAEANSARRSTTMGTFSGGPTLQVNRRSFIPDVLTSVYHFDVTLGTLQLWGIQTYQNGAIISTKTYGGHLNLSTTALGATTNYTESILLQQTPTSTNDSFTFVGHEKVTTQAGTFDTCKVRFNYSANNDGGSETYWLLPNVHWARLERVDPQGVHTTRELVSH